MYYINLILLIIFLQLQLPAVINIAIGIFLLDYSRSQAFNIFIIVSFVGTLMFITLHITYNLLPMIFKKRQGGMCM